MPEPEKVTINLGAVDLGKIDLLVQEGLYSNRTDFIRNAIRAQLEKHTIEMQEAVLRHHYVIGALIFDRADLEKHKAQGERVKISILGFLKLDSDISPELAAEVIESVQVRGIFHAAAAVKEALAGRIK